MISPQSNSAEAEVSPRNARIGNREFEAPFREALAVRNLALIRVNSRDSRVKKCCAFGAVTDSRVQRCKRN
jgi:hypothetical protein